jgi:SAM-dependent methyltransferase
VGAQTEILLQRFPHLRIQGVDASSEQIKAARARLKKSIQEKRANFDVGDALHLKYKDDSFDGAFVCWFLEHVQEPVGILQEIRRVLKPGSLIYCNEVLNATLYLNPYSPATLQYWFAFNDHQWTIRGDPFVGGKLANYLLAAGYQNIETEAKVAFYDNRSPKRRAQFIAYWSELLVSGAPGLLKAGRVTPALVKEMQAELARLQDDPDAVFFYSWIQAHARAY